MQLKIHHNCQTLSLQLVCTFFNLHNIYVYIHMFYTNKVHSFYFITCLLVPINSDIEYNALVQYSRFYPHQQSTSYLFDFCVKYYSTVTFILYGRIWSQKLLYNISILNMKNLQIRRSFTTIKKYYTISKYIALTKY